METTPEHIGHEEDGMSERKFKAGERVRIVNNGWVCDMYLGKVGTVREHANWLGRNDRIYVEFDEGGGDTAYHSDCELLVEPTRTITLDGVEFDLVPRKPEIKPHVFNVGDWGVLREDLMGVPAGAEVLLIAGEIGDRFVTIAHPEANDGKGWALSEIGNLAPSTRPRVEF